MQEVGIKTIPKKKKCKKAKWLSEEALQVAVKRREAKGKEERENYIHLNAEFQRIASRGKKVFLRFLDRRHSDWCEVVPHCGFDVHFSGEGVEKREPSYTVGGNAN